MIFLDVRFHSLLCSKGIVLKLYHSDSTCMANTGQNHQTWHDLVMLYYRLRGISYHIIVMEKLVRLKLFTFIFCFVVEFRFPMGKKNIDPYCILTLKQFIKYGNELKCLTFRSYNHIFQTESTSKFPASASLTLLNFHTYCLCFIIFF